MNSTRPPVRPPPPRPTKSGEHPSVRAFRAKLASVADHEGVRLDELIEELDTACAKLKTDG